MVVTARDVKPSKEILMVVNRILKVLEIKGLSVGESAVCLNIVHSLLPTSAKLKSNETVWSPTDEPKTNRHTQ